jgi:hypothetical protein
MRVFLRTWAPRVGLTGPAAKRMLIKQDEPLRSSPEMKICEIMAMQKKGRPVSIMEHSNACRTGSQSWSGWVFSASCTMRTEQSADSRSDATAPRRHRRFVRRAAADSLARVSPTKPEGAVSTLSRPCGNSRECLNRLRKSLGFRISRLTCITGNECTTPYAREMFTRGGR